MRWTRGVMQLVARVPAHVSRVRRGLGLVGQTVALGAGVWFLVRTAQRSWGTMAIADLSPAWLPIVAGSAITAATYLCLVVLWVISLRWWSQRLGWLVAARIWFVSNLARFIPGMIWQLAGVAAMAQSRGISPVAATGGVLLQQVVLLVTGVVVAVAWAPALMAPWAGRMSSGTLLGLVLAGVVAVAFLLPRLIPPLGKLAGRISGRAVSWPAPPMMEFVLYVVGLSSVWVSYGVAFWLFGHGVFGANAPPFTLAVGAFVASYVAGLLVVFAPSGLVVREAALVAALTPTVGGGAALVLALGSRLWLLAVELLTAFLIVAAHGVLQRAARGGTPR